MSIIILMAPAILWFLSLGGFLVVLKKERPRGYKELGFLEFFLKERRVTMQLE